MSWYSVRCVLDVGAGTFEERITLWSAESIDEAIALAEVEARDYVEMVGLASYAGLAQAYLIGQDQPQHGDEVFSLMRDSDLPPQAYLSTYFDTGSERQSRLSEGG